MALSRKLLEGMGLTEGQIDAIIEGHDETVSGLKGEIETIEQERDRYKKDAEKLPNVKKEVDDLKESLKAEDGKENPFEKQYNDLKAEFDEYKQGIETEKTETAQKKAYRDMLIKIGIPEKRVDSILKVSDWKKAKLDKEGNLKDAETLEKEATEEFGDFIVVQGTKGASTPTPPVGDAGGDGGKVSTASKIAEQYYADRYGIVKKED